MISGYGALRRNGAGERMQTRSPAPDDSLRIPAFLADAEGANGMAEFRWHVHTLPQLKTERPRESVYHTGEHRDKGHAGEAPAIRLTPRVRIRFAARAKARGAGSNHTIPRSPLIRVVPVSDRRTGRCLVPLVDSTAAGVRLDHDDAGPPRIPANRDFRHRARTLATPGTKHAASASSSTA